MNDLRPVWLTREQRDLVAALPWREYPWCSEIPAAWDAAPADAVETVRTALAPLRDLDPVNGIDLVKHASRAALRSLGMPKEAS